MDRRQWFVDQLEAEARRTRRALEQVPAGRDDWKPHEKSMPLGYLAVLVATMPSWIAMVVEREELDLKPAGGSNMPPPPACNPEALTKAMDEGVAGARRALENTTEERLSGKWQLKVAGKVVSEDARDAVLRDTFMHLSHHRGQLTVYLRLAGQTVPAIYGPSADDPRFD